MENLNIEGPTQSNTQFLRTQLIKIPISRINRSPTTRISFKFKSKLIFLQKKSCTIFSHYPFHSCWEIGQNVVKILMIMEDELCSTGLCPIRSFRLSKTRSHDLKKWLNKGFNIFCDIQSISRFMRSFTISHGLVSNSIWG